LFLTFFCEITSLGSTWCFFSSISMILLNWSWKSLWNQLNCVIISFSIYPCWIISSFILLDYQFFYICNIIFEMLYFYNLIHEILHIYNILSYAIWEFQIKKDDDDCLWDHWVKKMHCFLIMNELFYVLFDEWEWISTITTRRGDDSGGVWMGVRSWVHYFHAT
jgi:hypothetical protein